MIFPSFVMHVTGFFPYYDVFLSDESKLVSKEFKTQTKIPSK